MLPDESMDVDPNYDPSDFLPSIKKERPDHDPNEEDVQRLNEDHGDHQMDQSYDGNQYDVTQLQPHQMKAELQPYELQQIDNQNYGDGGGGGGGPEMFQQQHVVLDDGQHQQYMVYGDEHQPQAYDQAVMMNVSDNLVYQNVDESGRVVRPMQYQQADPDDDGLGVGIDDDLAVSDSDDEEALNAGDPPQQPFDATAETPEQPAAATFAAAKQETALDVDADDDGGDLWF